MAAMLLAELAAQVKAAGQTLHEKLDALYWQYGCHAEIAGLDDACPAREGMARMRTLMARSAQRSAASIWPAWRGRGCATT